jgi:hypothetical protein
MQLRSHMLCVVGKLCAALLVGASALAQSVHLRSHLHVAHAHHFAVQGTIA